METTYVNEYYEKKLYVHSIKREPYDNCFISISFSSITKRIPHHTHWLDHKALISAMQHS